MLIGGAAPLRKVELDTNWQLLGYCICTAVQQTATPQNSDLADPLRPTVDAGWSGPADLANLGSVGVQNTTPSG
jgi:hypothetical protein